MPMGCWLLMPENNFLGIDTSNYTTSVALWTPKGLVSRRKLLPVKAGVCGLRQSDAVFLHQKQFPTLLEDLLLPSALTAVGVAARPEDRDGSYMPCFTTGDSFARVLALAFGCPLYSFSHQQGHVAAGVWSSGQDELTEQPFLAFHVSGGTTELMYAKNLQNLTVIGRTLDINAGQLIDRVGVRLGCSFPCGKQMDELAQNGRYSLRHKIYMRDGNCSFSGFENQAQALLERGEAAETVAFFVISAVGQALCSMLDTALERYSGFPVLMVGGVCCNSLLRLLLTERYGAYFAAPEFSGDNAAGIAYLTKRRTEGKQEWR